MVFERKGEFESCPLDVQQNSVGLFYEALIYKLLKPVSTGMQITRSLNYKNENKTFILYII